LAKSLRSGHQKIQISTIGNTSLIAESKIILTGFKPGIPTIWTITKAEHTLDSGGFRSQIEGEIYDG
jgi:phage protein D